MNSLAEQVECPSKVDSRLGCQCARSPVVDDRSRRHRVRERENGGIADIPVTYHQASREPPEGSVLGSGRERTALNPVRVQYRPESRVGGHTLLQLRHHGLRNDGTALTNHDLEDAE